MTKPYWLLIQIREWLHTKHGKTAALNSWKAKAMSPYSIIYADPAWRYGDKRKTLKGYSGAETHYKTMSISEIKELPVREISSENSALFIWVVMPLLQEGLDVIKAWGFKYKTCAFSWMKTNKSSDKLFGRGVGSYTMPNIELCLLGVRGKFFRNKKNVYQALLHPRMEHSKKPDEIRNRIVELCGDLPRIELFARQRVAGWDVFGNQVEGSIRLPTPLALDGGDSAALQALSTPEVLSTLQGEFTPAHRK